MVAKSTVRRYTRKRRDSWLHRLLWIEPFWLLGLAPSLLFTEYFWEPALRPAALFLFWPLRLKVTGAVLPRGATGWFVGFLLLWLPVTIWRSTNSVLAWEIAGYLYFALVAFVALIHWPPLRQQPAWLALLLLALGGALAVMGPQAFSLDPDKLFDLYQPAEFSATSGNPFTAGETINPNILGGALALILPLGVALVFRWPWVGNRWRAWLLWAPILLIGNGLLLSQSRSSWLAVGVAGLLLGWLLLQHRPQATPARGTSVTRHSPGRVTDAPRAETVAAGDDLASGRGWRWLAGGLVAGLLIVLLVWYMAVTTFLTDSALAQSAGASLIRRLDIWRLSLQLVKAQPVTGIGLGNYEAVFTAAFPTLPLVGGRLAPPHAHNLFLQVALDVGLPGLVAHLGLLALLLRSVGSRLWTPRRRRTTIFATSAVAIGVYGALVALLVIGCFDNALWGTKLTLIPWTLFALAFLVGEGESFHAAVR